jgi:hypothetical protein
MLQFLKRDAMALLKDAGRISVILTTGVAGQPLNMLLAKLWLLLLTTTHGVLALLCTIRVCACRHGV